MHSLFSLAVQTAPATGAFQRTTAGSIKPTATPCVTPWRAVSGLAQAWAAPSIDASIAAPARNAPSSMSDQGSPSGPPAAACAPLDALS